MGGGVMGGRRNGRGHNGREARNGMGVMGGEARNGRGRNGRGGSVMGTNQSEF